MGITSRPIYSYGGGTGPPLRPRTCKEFKEDLAVALTEASTPFGLGTLIYKLGHEQQSGGSQVVFEQPLAVLISYDDYVRITGARPFTGPPTKEEQHEQPN